MEEARKIIIFIIINVIALLCYLFGKENLKRKKEEHYSCLLRINGS